MRSYLVILIVSFTEIVWCQFDSGTQLSLGPSDPKFILSEDLDGDGDLDVLVVSEFGINVGWYENLGAGNFSKFNIISDDLRSASHATMNDFDGDGDKDLVVSCDHVLASLTSLVFFENLGSGNFGPQQVIASSMVNAHEITSLDFDGDTDIDVVLVKNNGYFWFENLGSGTFGSAQNIPDINGDYVAIASGDLDGDLDDDLIVARSSPNKLFKLENLGNGNFAPSVSISVSINGIRSVVLRDIDNDLDLDVLLSSYSDDEIIWYENTAGDFVSGQNVIAVLNGPVNADAGDFDGDGDLDIVAASFLDDKIVRYENLGAGIFGPEEILSQEYQQATGAIVSDLDGDSDIDVISSSGYQNKVSWYINDGSGVFSPKQLISDTLMHSNRPEDVFPADLDGDGDDDILFVSFSDASVLWFENLGGGEFDSVHHVITDTLEEPTSVFAIDLDSDNDLDIISNSRTQDIVVWFENLGSGMFGPYQIITNNTNNPNTVSSVDLDNDGDNDVLSSSYSDDKFAWYENLGGTFSSQNILSVNSNGPVDLKAADFNNDSLQDVVGISIIDDKIVWFENLGSGIFSSEILIDDQIEGPEALVTADADQDGDMDVFVCFSPISASVVVLYENIGNGNFAPAVGLPGLILGANNLCASDLDADGDSDIAVTGDDQLYWYENLGGNSFATASLVYIDADGPTSVSAADIDHDGDNDLICSSYDDDKIIWFKNYAINKNQAKGLIFVDFAENGVLDSNDIGLNFLQVEASPVQAYTYTYGNGNFNIILDGIGSYQISPQSILDWHLTTDSSFYNVFVDSNYTVVDSLIFGFFPDTVITDLNCQLVGATSPCDQIKTLWGSIQNLGSSLPSGIIELELDPSLTYVSNMYSTPDSIIGQNIYWSFDSLYYYQDLIKEVQIQMPGVASIGDTLMSYFKASVQDSSGSTIYIQVDTLTEILTCAYDPNDKLVEPKGSDSLGFIPITTSQLDYTIRFQNTGTDTALNVLIKDQLDANLEFSSLQVLASSHTVQINIDQNGLIEFLFENIMLPDSNINEPGSHGFVKFRVALKPNLTGGTTIYNTSEIYFDQNPPIFTNTTINTLECLTYQIDFSPIQNDTLCEYYIPLNLLANPSGGSFSGVGVSGNQFDPSTAGEGSHQIYYTFVDTLGCITTDSIQIWVNACLDMGSNTFPNLTIYPNPFNDLTTVSFGRELNGGHNIKIYDALGREVYIKENVSGNQLQIQKDQLRVGIYLFSIFDNSTGEEVFNAKLVVE